MIQCRQQLGEGDQLLEIEDERADREIRPCCWSSSISPLAGHTERASRGAPQDKPLDARDPALLQDREPLTSEWVKWVGDLSPSQRLFVVMCSSR